MIKCWSDEAWEDFEYWTKQDRKTLKRILQLIKDIDRNGYDCIGRPEPLRHDLTGWWSVRINEADRLVFRIVDDCIEILACKGHYN